MNSIVKTLQAAMLDHQAGRIEAAKSAYKDILALEPTNVDATHLLGIAILQLGDAQAAIEQLSAAVDLRPDNSTFHFNLGVAQAKAVMTEDAIDSYQTALNLNPRNSGAANNLAVLLGADGDLEGAETVLRKILTLNTHDLSAAVNLADILCRLALPEYLKEAENLCRGVINEAPDMAKAHSVLSQSMSIGDRRGEALGAAQTAVKLEPDNALFHEQVADLQSKLGDNEAAELAARQSFKLNENSARSAGILGTALLGLSRAEEAVDWCLRAIDLDPGGMEFTEAFAAADLYVSFLKMGQWGRATQLVDLENLVHSQEISVPEGFETVTAFNASLIQAIKNHHSLQWNPSGYVTRGGAITGNVLLQPSTEFLAMETTVRKGIDIFTASLQTMPEHHFRRDLKRRYRMVMWAVILEKEGHLEPHIHEGSWISGVYYVSIPQFTQRNAEPHPGAIEFGRPAEYHGVKLGFKTRVVQPQDGRLVLFPSSMFHRTIPFQADKPRICVSFNCFPY